MRRENMKRLLSLVLVLVIVFTLLPVAAFADTVASGTCGDNLSWTLDSNGILVINGTGDMTNYSYDPAPWDSQSSSIKSVVISDGVTSIGDWAFFNCSSLTSVTIPDSITSIGSWAFAGCSSLTSVSIPSSITSIGNSAFRDCSSLTSVSIPNSVTSIGNYGFYECSGLENITIPASVTYVGIYTFFGCSRLKSVTFAGCPNTISSSAFSEVITTAYYYSEDNWPASKLLDYGGHLTWVLLSRYTHDYAAVVTEPTCTEQGYTTYTCNICGNSYKVNFVQAVGHDFKNGLCTRCREKNSDFVPVNPFVDVKAGSVYYDAILWAYYHAPQQITGGFDTTHFVPNNLCTRAQVVTFLWRAKGCPEPTTTTNPFSDVNPGSVFYKAILWAAEEGITTGYAGGLFKPNDTVTRAQFVTFLWRANGKPSAGGSISGFADAEIIAAPYQTAVVWAVRKGITTGYADNTFRPNAACTRWAVVLFMYRDMADLTNDSSKEWKQAYIDVINALHPNGTGADYYKCMLIYVNNDNIPELLVRGSSSASGDIIYTYKNGAVYKQCLSNWSVSYYEKGNLFRDEGGRMGTYYERIWEIGENGFVMLYYGNYQETISQGGAFSRNYYWQKVKVSETDYYNLRGSVFDTDNAISPYDSEVGYLTMINIIREM